MKALYINLAAVFAVLPASAWASDSDVIAKTGSLQLTGNGGCANLNHSPYLLAFSHRFAKVPEVEVTARVADPGDSVSVQIVKKARSYVKVEVTGQGLNGNQICAAAYLD